MSDSPCAGGTAVPGARDTFGPGDGGGAARSRGGSLVPGDRGGDGQGPRGPSPAEPAPPLGSWGRLYALVIAALIADIVLLRLLTEHFR